MNNEEHKELLSALRITNSKLDTIQGILLSCHGKAIVEQGITKVELQEALSYVEASNVEIWRSQDIDIGSSLKRDEDSRRDKILVHEFWSPSCGCSANSSLSGCRCGSFLYHRATFSDFIDILIERHDYPKVRRRSAEQLEGLIRKIGSTKVSTEVRSFYRRKPGVRLNQFELDHVGFLQLIAEAELDIQIIGSADKYPDICIYRKQLGIATAAEVAESMELEADRYREAKFQRGMR